MKKIIPYLVAAALAAPILGAGLSSASAQPGQRQERRVEGTRPSANDTRPDECDGHRGHARSSDDQARGAGHGRGRDDDRRGAMQRPDARGEMRAHHGRGRHAQNERRGRNTRARR